MTGVMQGIRPRLSFDDRQLDAFDQRGMLVEANPVRGEAVATRSVVASCY
jgi:hypothetical protein